MKRIIDIKTFKVKNKTIYITKEKKNARRNN